MNIKNNSRYKCDKDDNEFIMNVLNFGTLLVIKKYNTINLKIQYIITCIYEFIIYYYGNLS